LPSVDRCGSRFVSGMTSVPAVAGSYVAFIKFNIRDTTVGCNGKKHSAETSKNVNVVNGVAG
jgi:hypothetical protein